jgi:hypothetical protein
MGEHCGPYKVTQHDAAAMADGLEDLLDLDDEADVEHGHSQLNVAKVAGAGRDVLLARGARKHAVDGAELGVVEALLAGGLSRLVLRRR